MPVPSPLRLWWASGAAFVLVAFSVCGAPPAGPKGNVLPPPATFQDDPGTRFVTLEWKDATHANLTLRSVGGPGSYGRWYGSGELTEKGIEFAQKVDEGDRGTLYLATGGQAKLLIKVKPGQAGAADAGLSGSYHHITDEKLASLLKKDYEAAEKKLEEAIRLSSRKAPADDKPGYAEWKRRWPELRQRVLAVAQKPPPKNQAAAPTGSPPASSAGKSPPPFGQAPSAGPEKTPAYWMPLAETTAAATGFIAPGVPVGLKPGWDGLFEDGFGGSVDLMLMNTGVLRFTMNCGRGDGTATGMMEGRILPPGVKEGKDKKDATADYTDHNPEVKEDQIQTRVHFHRIGHFLIVETQEAQRYANRAWFDGVYLKRPPRVEE